MINDYEVFLRLKTDRDQLARKVRNAEFVKAATQDTHEKAQPRRLRFHLHLPRLSGFRLGRRRQPRCTPLNAA
jgi:hypothetical protein